MVGGPELEEHDDTYRIEGFLIKARAMEILCFCPPESKTPFVPTIVSNPSLESI